MLASSNIERIDGLPFGRCYKVIKDSSTYYLPSVTTILKMKPTPKYDAIRAELGEEKYKLAMQRAADRGTVMHKWLEEFLDYYGKHKNDVDAFRHTQQYISTTTEFDTLATEKARAMKIGRDLFYNFYHNKFWVNTSPIKNVLHNEVFMHSLFKGGWAGASDFVYEDFDGNHVIADFKSSRIKKDPDEIDSYRMQIACYMFMYSEMYGVIPSRGEILIANESDNDIQKVVVPLNDDAEHGYGMKYWLKEFLHYKELFHKTPEWMEFESKLAEERVV